MFKALNGNREEVNIEHVKQDCEYFCPICKGLVIPKAQKSLNVAAHFAHKNRKQCDTFSHDMSEWHKKWQSIFPVRNQEVALPFENPCHRADVLAYGYVIEFQHSPISIEEFDERNSFYTSLGKKVIWIFDVNEKYENDKFELQETKYEYAGKYTSYDGRIKNKWIVNEYRIGTLMTGHCGPFDDYDVNDLIDYKYGRNDKATKHKCHEWRWINPLKTFRNYHPQVNVDIILFLEYEPDKLQKIIWCDDKINVDICADIEEDFHEYGYEFMEKLSHDLSIYLKYRDKIIIKSDFSYFTGAEYTTRELLMAIKDRNL